MRGCYKGVHFKILYFFVGAQIFVMNDGLFLIQSVYGSSNLASDKCVF